VARRSATWTSLAATEANEAVIERFVEWESADDEIESGPEKASIRVGEIRVDLRVVVPAEFGSALQYFTGSKDHNVSLRNYAIDREMKLNEYGAFDVSEVPDAEDGQRVGDRVAGETEAGMYEALGLPWIPPELRTDRGEIAAAENGELPDLITRDDIRGDLHTHTEWSDGATPISAMVEAAAERGYDYFGIADHAQGPGIVGGMGLSDTDILEQVEEIRAVGDEADIEVFAGIEANVDAHGEIDLSEAVIEALDVIVASTHSALGQDAETATDRLVRALKNPAIDVLGPPQRSTAQRALRPRVRRDRARAGRCRTRYRPRGQQQSPPAGSLGQCRPGCSRGGCTNRDQHGLPSTVDARVHALGSPHRSPRLG